MTTHPNLTQSVIDFIRSEAHGDQYGAYCRNRLVELLEADARAANAAGAAAAQEAAVLELIENEVRQLPIQPGVVERLSLGASGGPVRSGLLVGPGAESSSGPGLLFVTPLEVAGAPLAPRSAADEVVGRGAAGSRSQIVLALAQMKLLAELKDRLNAVPHVPVAWCFVPGGVFEDGAARSLASEPRFRGWSTVVFAPTDGWPQTAQPGLVSFRCTITGAAALEVFPFVVRAVETEGVRLRAESVAAGTPTDCAETVVQTNHGMLAGYGTHPALACERMAVIVDIRANANPERIAMRMTEVLNAAMAERLRRRIDLTKQNDVVTGEPKLKRHYALSLIPSPDALRYRIEILGRSAWPGAPAEADSAISKAAFLFASLIRIRQTFPNVRASASLADPPAGGAAGGLLIRGIQTFLAPHDSAAVRRRLADAARAGLVEGRQLCRAVDADVRMEFDSPAREPLAPSTKDDAEITAAFASAVRLAADRAAEPAIWPGMSCADAFAAQGSPVIFGPGQLHRFATPHEGIQIRDVQRSLDAVVAATLSYQARTG